MRISLFALISILIFSCSQRAHHPEHGSWRAVLDLGNNKKLPFMVDFTEDHHFVIYNAEEEIITEPVIIRGDSIIVHHPVFEGVLKGTFTAKTIRGSFITAGLKREVPFTMTFGLQERFKGKGATSADISGNWEMVFTEGSPDETYIGKGIFDQDGNKVTGTIRTTTGDYRFLEGIVDADSLRLSTFDMAHAFLFEAGISDSSMTGTFYSGNHYTASFTAKRNEQFELPQADSLTFLKEGYDRIAFSFPDTEGNLVSLEDEQFKDKVVVVQVMGSWCPNCLDESRYFTEYYSKNPSEELEFVSLAFEYVDSEEKAMEGLKRLKDKVGIPYPVLLAQYGSRDKKIANEKLPMLNHVLSYPTTIFIDKQGQVRKIHTGFNGPATGEKYDEFVAEFEAFIAQLLAE